MFLGNKRDERWRARPLKPLDWRRRRRRCLTFTRVESPLPPSHVYLSIRACKDASKVSHLASELGQNHGVCRPFGHGGGRIKRVSVRVVLPWCQEHLWLSCLGLAARRLFAALAASRCLCSSCELFPSTSATKPPPVQTQFNLEAAFVRIFKIKNHKHLQVPVSFVSAAAKSPICARQRFAQPAARSLLKGCTKDRKTRMR